MKNPAEHAQKIVSSLSAVIDGPVGKQLVGSNKQRLSDAQTLAARLCAELQAINAEVISLDMPDTDSGSAAREIWQKLPAGVVRDPSPQMEKLRNASETLNELYQAGFDIIEIQKLSKKQLDVSRRIGDDFKEIHHVWDRFKLAIARNENFVSSSVEHIDEAVRFFAILRDEQIIAGFSPQLFAYRDKRWIDLPPARIRTVRNRQSPVRVAFDFDRSFSGLITGHWFNGYVYDALNDQLRRMKVDYELYPLLRYRCRVNTALARGEFDILARIGRQRLIVECKSGRLQVTDDRDDFRALVETERALEERFAKTRLARGLFILVYNPFLTPTADVDQQLATTDIRAVPIDDMRGNVIDLVNELSAA